VRLSQEARVYQGEDKRDKTPLTVAHFPVEPCTPQVFSDSREVALVLAVCRAPEEAVKVGTKRFHPLALGIG